MTNVICRHSLSRLPLYIYIYIYIYIYNIYIYIYICIYRIEKRERNVTLEISTPVKIINVVNWKRLCMTDSNFLQLIVHVWNLMARLSLIHCFSCHCFYKYFLSQNSQSSLVSLIQEGSQ